MCGSPVVTGDVSSHSFLRDITLAVSSMSHSMYVPSVDVATATERAAVWAFLGDKLGATSGAFPSPLPHVATRRALVRIADVRRPYLLLKKTDGYHYMLVLLRVHNAPTAIMMSRSLKMYRISVGAPARAFDGTIMEGELLSTGSDGLMTFYIFRLLWLHGEDQRARSFKERQHMAASAIVKMSKSQCLANWMRSDVGVKFFHDQACEGRIGSRQPKLRFAVKRMYPVSAAKEIWASLGKYNDGIIITPDLSHFQLARLPELKLKATYTTDLLFRAYKSVRKERLDMEVLYLCGGSLINAYHHLMYNAADVALEVITDKSAPRAKAFRVWLQGFRDIEKGEVTEQIIECKVHLSTLTRAEAKRHNNAAAERRHAVAYSMYGAPDSELPPRKFTYKLVCEFIKPRPDKDVPDSLPSIISLLAQERSVSVDDVMRVANV